MSYPKIDFHAHYLTKPYRDFAFDNFGPRPDGMPTPEWNIEKQLDMMRINNIEYSLSGLSSPYPYLKDRAEVARLASENNTAAAGLFAPHKDVLGFLAAISIPYIEESLDAIDEAYVLGAKGFSLCTNIGGTYLGDPSLDPIMKKLDEKKAIVHIHPAAPSSVPKGVCESLPIPAFEFFYDTTRTFVNMSMNGTFKKFPEIRFIFSHAGAMIPFIAERVNGIFSISHIDGDMLKDIAHVYFDLAGFCEKYQLQMLLDMAPVSHLFYGSDFPFTPQPVIAQTAAELESTDKLNEAEKLQIFKTNAEKLGVFNETGI